MKLLPGVKICWIPSEIFLPTHLSDYAKGCYGNQALLRLRSREDQAMAELTGME